MGVRRVKRDTSVTGVRG